MTGETETNWVNEHGARPVIRLFGPLAIEDGSQRLGPRDLGGVRPKQVLEILLAARGHRVPVDRLAELIWGEEQPQNVTGSLQTFVSMLRRHLSSDRDRARELVVTETEAYRFATELVSLDLDRFDELLERSAREPTRGARASLEQALALVRGEVLEDEPYATWALDVRGSYRGRVLGARLEAADAALAELDYEPALAHAEAAAALDRFSERAQRLAMLALHALGRQHDALGRYRSFRTMLDEELGLDPTPETRSLESAILRQEDVSLLLPRPIVRAQEPGPQRSVRLLGRVDELDALERAADEARSGRFVFVEIEGDAGLGKTRMLDEAVAVFEGFRVGRAHGSALERHLPYVPLATAIRDSGIELDRPSDAALGPILPELAVTASTQGVSEVEALEALVELVARNAPLVLMIDDLHHADEATLAALDYLQHRCSDVAVGVVTTVRSVYAPPEHPLRRLTPSVHLELSPLTAEELAPLGISGIYEATGGNPRFVTDTVASGKRLELSDSLTEALLSQLRAEGQYAYRILRTASLLAQPFEPETLAGLVGLEVSELVEELERLCELRILRVDGFRFRFRYDLVREVLLGSISPARQRLVHQQLAKLDPDAMASRPAA
jgi:DNA-binding SARP family transcriptional activator